MPAHTTLPGDRGHHQPVAPERPQGSRKGHPTGGLHLQVLVTQRSETFGAAGLTVPKWYCLRKRQKGGFVRNFKQA